MSEDIKYSLVLLTCAIVVAGGCGVCLSQTSNVDCRWQPPLKQEDIRLCARAEWTNDCYMNLGYRHECRDKVEW